MALINTTTTGIQGTTIYADGTGSLTVQQNGATLGVYGNQPAFLAYVSSNQSVTHNTSTKIQFATEVYDTASCYDNSTNYRFTPNVAGYYFTSLTIRYGFSGAAGKQLDNVLYVYRNGSAYLMSEHSFVMGTGNVSSLHVTGLIYMNGSTDYIEGYFLPYDYTASSTQIIYSGTGPYSSYFSSVLIKAV
jgi:hypothetical protein